MDPMTMMGAMTSAGGIVSGIGGIDKVAGSFIGRKARIAEQKAANAELARRKAEYEGMDITNPYANLENTYEDLEVNTQQAEFIARQNQQQQANIMQGLQGAAGGAGIAALAQQMDNQGQQQIAAASASIGQQEQANKMAAARGEEAIQAKKAAGEQWKFAQEKDRTETLFGMAQQRKGAADAARQRATDMLTSGIGDIAGGVMSFGMGNKMAGKGFWGGEAS